MNAVGTADAGGSACAFGSRRMRSSSASPMTDADSTSNECSQSPRIITAWSACGSVPKTLARNLTLLLRKDAERLSR